MLTVEKGTGKAVHAAFFCQLRSRIKPQVIANGTTLRLPKYHLTQKTHNVIFVPVNHLQAETSCQLLHGLPPPPEFLVGMDVGVVKKTKDTCSFTLQDLERVNGTWRTTHVEEYFHEPTSFFVRQSPFGEGIIRHSAHPGKL